MKRSGMGERWKRRSIRGSRLALERLIAHSKTMLRSVTREVHGHSGLARLGPERGVYSRLRVSDFLLGSSAKERPMGSKRVNRRELLKSGATLAGGFTLGAAAPALGPEPMTHASPPLIKGDNEGQNAYGDRSKHLKTIPNPPGGRPTPGNLRATLPV